MRCCLALVGTLPLFCLSAAAQEPRRELAAHEHGRGTLDMAIEGERVSIGLEAPGMDIVGFEHAAKTATQKKAVDGAKSTLSKPLALFRLPGAAGCRAREVKVELATEEHKQDPSAPEKGKDAKAETGRNKGGAPKEASGKHTEFHAEYTLECSNPSALTTIEFDYFKSFKRAVKLDVNVITPKGQMKYEVTRDKPRVDLAGLV
jgi:hypothetical protein